MNVIEAIRLGVCPDTEESIFPSAEAWVKGKYVIDVLENQPETWCDESIRFYSDDSADPESGTLFALLLTCGADHDHREEALIIDATTGFQYADIYHAAGLSVPPCALYALKYKDKSQHLTTFHMALLVCLDGLRSIVGTHVPSLIGTMAKTFAVDYLLGLHGYRSPLLWNTKTEEAVCLPFYFVSLPIRDKEYSCYEEAYLASTRARLEYNDIQPNLVPPMDSIFLTFWQIEISGLLDYMRTPFLQAATAIEHLHPYKRDQHQDQQQRMIISPWNHPTWNLKPDFPQYVSNIWFHFTHVPLPLDRVHSLVAQNMGDLNKSWTMVLKAITYLCKNASVNKLAKEGFIHFFMNSKEASALNTKFTAVAASKAVGASCVLRFRATMDDNSTLPVLQLSCPRDRFGVCKHIGLLLDEETGKLRLYDQRNEVPPSDWKDSVFDLFAPVPDLGQIFTYDLSFNGRLLHIHCIISETHFLQYYHVYGYMRNLVAV